MHEHLKVKYSGYALELVLTLIDKSNYRQMKTMLFNIRLSKFTYFIKDYQHCNHD